MILLTEGQTMSRLFDLDWQLVADSCLTIIAVFVLFLFMSYFLFNPARKMLNSRKDKIRAELETAKKDMDEAGRALGKRSCIFSVDDSGFAKAIEKTV